MRLRDMPSWIRLDEEQADAGPRTPTDNLPPRCAACPSGRPVFLISGGCFSARGARCPSPLATHTLAAYAIATEAMPTPSRLGEPLAAIDACGVRDPFGIV